MVEQIGKTTVKYVRLLGFHRHFLYTK